MNNQNETRKNFGDFEMHTDHLIPYKDQKY